jgi:CobQ-like glutamine amidotransferase family enzyme
VAERTLRVCALYPDLMNIYADRGNLLLLRRRCAWRGIGFELRGAGLGDRIDADAHDLFYLGGGQDRDQQLCAEDLATVKRDALFAAADRGAVLFGVCGGYQLLGHAYQLGHERLPGIGLVDLETVREEGPRLIGNVAIEVDLGQGPAVLAGFENHAGRTRLGPAAQPLGRVLRGHGNDGRSGDEGVRGGPRGTVLGTYLHGPLLPKNAWFADWLTATALGVEPGSLAPLDDRLEDAAHAAALRAAG